ncbi:MAG TPA: indole-3-glycerol phosphate synthase TrpC [Dehalococcoidia bacterium]|nr:indole-3-glycerol phosphate synthase TrpC [Dehalococcoidia bacterium]
MTNRGVTETGSVLDRIVADWRTPLEEAKRVAPVEALRAQIDTYGPQWSLTAAITTPRGAAPAGAAVQIVAEIKKASPSRGVLAEILDPVAIAEAYTNAGAAAISIVTEPNHFLGDLRWLRAVRQQLEKAQAGTRPSLLRKDFIFDSYQLLQARAYGADNALLIVAMLDDALLRDLLDESRALDLDALVEVHTEGEAERAIKAGATLFGINNRDLNTFKVDLAVTERVRPVLPPDAVVIGESGVHTRADVERLHRAGVRAILVGEAFMTAPDVAAKMAELRL